MTLNYFLAFLSAGIELFINQTSEGLTIVVDDTGCGISEENIQKIYEGRFTTRGEGHGIGLTLIQEIVKKHDGYLTIESEPEVGSSFTISIQKTRDEIERKNRKEVKTPD